MKARIYQNEQGKCRVSFYCDSYQYRDSIIFNVKSDTAFETFEAVKTTAGTILREDKLNSRVSGTYWATFSFEEQVEGYRGVEMRFNELFGERIEAK